ncbi:MAG: DNA polymerase III subunit beta, partial [Firmicutes bacterium]|nr:DNA polymerase III subunit beta [Bacillota bacterium]
MHFKANTSILTQKLDIIEKAIPSRTTLDILENIFVSAAKDQLTLIST